MEGPHVTITHVALDLIIQGPPAPWAWDLTMQGPQVAENGNLSKLVHLRTNPLPVLKSISQEWTPVQTCSLEDPLPVLTSGDY